MIQRRARRARARRSNRRATGGREHSPTDLADLLRRARFEVLPLDGVEEAVRTHLGHGREGHGDGVPRQRAGRHLRPERAARVRRLPGGAAPLGPAGTDRSHLDAMLDRLLAGGITDVFVLAGDPPEPAGEFHGAADLLEAMGPRRAEFEAIGITGYPESHHLISDEETIRAMFVKAADGHPHREPDLLRRRDDRRLGRQGPRPRHRSADLDRAPGPCRLHEAPAHVDEDRAGRVRALPAPPPGLALASALASVQARSARGESSHPSSSSPPGTWPASTSTPSTRWGAPSAGGATTLEGRSQVQD